MVWLMVGPLHRVTFTCTVVALGIVVVLQIRDHCLESRRKHRHRKPDDKHSAQWKELESSDLDATKKASKQLELLKEWGADQCERQAEKEKCKLVPSR